MAKTILGAVVLVIGDEHVVVRVGAFADRRNPADLRRVQLLQRYPSSMPIRKALKATFYSHCDCPACQVTRLNGANCVRPSRAITRCAAASNGRIAHPGDRTSALLPAVSCMIRYSGVITAALVRASRRNGQGVLSSAMGGGFGSPCCSPRLLTLVSLGEGFR